MKTCIYCIAVVEDDKTGGHSATGVVLLEVSIIKPEMFRSTVLRDTRLSR